MDWTRDPDEGIVIRQGLGEDTWDSGLETPQSPSHVPLESPRATTDETEEEIVQKLTPRCVGGGVQRSPQAFASAD